MTTTATHQVTIVTDTYGTVHGHKAGCADVARMVSKGQATKQSVYTETVANKHEVWLDYNQDFLAEGSGAYGIEWKSCAKHVPQGPEDNEETWDQEETTPAPSTTTEKESTKMSTTPSIPNVRTYDTASKTLRIKALGVDCTIPYCRATPDQSCVSAKGKEVEPHTRRVQRALAMEKAAAKKAAKAKADPKAASKAAAEPAEQTVHPSAKAAATKLAKKAAALAKGDIDTAEVCKPCKTSHHKQCKGTEQNPCGCVSKTHVAA